MLILLWKVVVMSNLFGQRLKELRLEKGLTQEELSKLSGISFPTISRYENGIRNEPKRSILKTLANFFGVTMDYLSGDSDIRDATCTATEIAKIYEKLNDDDKRLLMELAKSLLMKEGKA
jgi:repressor LexA